MITAIHQPQYLPWLGYFDKMRRSDVFILLDDVQFKKNEWQNRNRIRTPKGWQWLTVPILHNFGQLIKEVRPNPRESWRTEHCKALEFNYKRAPYFQEYWPQLLPFFMKSWDNLSELNCTLVRSLAQMLGLKTRIVLSSEIAVTTTKTQRLIDLCRAVNCDTYLAGSGCGAYMEIDLFKDAGIVLDVQDYRHPVYSQLWAQTGNEFISHLSVLDCLFNCGPEALGILAGDTRP